MERGKDVRVAAMLRCIRRRRAATRSPPGCFPDRPGRRPVRGTRRRKHPHGRTSRNPHDSLRRRSRCRAASHARYRAGAGPRRLARDARRADRGPLSRSHGAGGGFDRSRRTLQHRFRDAERPAGRIARLHTGHSGLARFDQHGNAGFEPGRRARFEQFRGAGLRGGRRLDRCRFGGSRLDGSRLGRIGRRRRQRRDGGIGLRLRRRRCGWRFGWWGPVGRGPRREAACRRVAFLPRRCSSPPWPAGRRAARRCPPIHRAPRRAGPTPPCRPCLGPRGSRRPTRPAFPPAPGRPGRACRLAPRRNPRARRRRLRPRPRPARWRLSTSLCRGLAAPRSADTALPRRGSLAPAGAARGAVPRLCAVSTRAALRHHAERRDTVRPPALSLNSRSRCCPGERRDPGHPSSTQRRSPAPWATRSARSCGTARRPCHRRERGSGEGEGQHLGPLLG
ncbi:MAG: hypothetical protein JWR00_4789 [Rubritepida sp.]|nr:hypothetical protein [Rubritepida sp.]